MAGLSGAAAKTGLPEGLDLALVDVVPCCLPGLESKIGSPHPCLGEHRQTAGAGRAACEHTPPVAERQTAGNEIQNASLPQLVVQ